MGTAAIGALFLHRLLTVQSRGERTRRVDWAQSSALLVRREAAAAVDYMDPEFFVYYDECDFCRRLAKAGWHTLYVPAAEAVHHDQLSTDLAAGLPRIVEFTATATSTCASTAPAAATCEIEESPLPPPPTGRRDWTAAPGSWSRSSRVRAGSTGASAAAVPGVAR